jgi:hypothetical protein
MLEVLERFRHRRFRRDLSAYMDDMLPERARRRLEAHLDSCQACRQELAELRATVEALGSLPMAEAPRSFTLAAAPVAEVRPRPVARRLEFGLRLATATAAFALTVVMIGDFVGLPGGGEEEMPAAMQSALVQTPAAEETPAAVGGAPTETPAAEETPAAPEVAPGETPQASGITGTYGYSGVEPEPTVGAGVSEGGEAEEKALEGAGVEEEAGAGAAEAQAVAEEEGGGLSQEEVVRWLEIGLGAGVGVLVVLWAFARLQRNIGNRP